MMIVCEGLSAIGDSRALLPFAAVLALLIPGPLRQLQWRWMAAITMVAGLTLASKIAYMGWGLGVESLDFTGISGHAAMSSTVYPIAFWLLAYGRSRRPRAWALAGSLLATAIAASRLPLGAHSLSEILVGLCLGFTASASTLHGFRTPQGISGVRTHVAALAVVVSVATPALLEDVHSHDLVKATAKMLSGRERTLDRDDLHSFSPPAKQIQ